MVPDYHSLTVYGNIASSDFLGMGFEFCMKFYYKNNTWQLSKAFLRWKAVLCAFFVKNQWLLKRDYYECVPISLKLVR